MADSLRLVDAREIPAHTEWLRQVYPFYLHDLSEFEAREYRLSASGLWEPDHLPYWLSEPFCQPLVVLESGTPAGFAFVGEAPFPFMSPGARFRLSEFFVLRAHRRSGLGRRAALRVLARASGPWELTVLERNAPALAFWRGLLPEAAEGPVREEAADGLVRFSFSSAVA